MLVARLDLPSESEPPPIASRPSYVHRESFGPMVAGGEAGLAVTADAGVIANPLGASAWGATGRGIGLGAKKAGTATASATTTAANSVKDSAVKTAKTLHRVTGSIFSKLR
jgi:hypothetical protein